jgi:flagellar biosynthesis protein FliQ
MTHSSLEFQVEQLRARNLQRTLESLLVFILAIFVSALLPSLLVRYLYAGQQLFEEPQLLQYIPVVSFVIGVAYFIYAVVTNLMREMKATRLERQMMGSTGASSMTDLHAAMERVEASASRSTSPRSKTRKTAKRK